MTHKNTEQWQTGFNLIEAAIVLAIIGLVIGTIWVAAAVVNDAQKIEETKKGVIMTANNMQNLISSADATTIGNSASLTNAAIAAQAFPANWITSSTTAKNPYGGSFTVANYALPPRFDVYLHGIPYTACVKLLTQISAYGAMAGSLGAGSSGRTGLGYISIKTDDGATTLLTTTTFPVSPTTAASVCDPALNFMVFTFGYTR